MLVKTFMFLSMCLTLSVTIFSQSNNPVKIIQNGDVFTSNPNPIVQQDVNGNWSLSTQEKIAPITYETNLVTFTTQELSTDARTVYDLQSNGCIRYIWQNPANALQMHACFMVSTNPSAWPDRNVRYFYTTNGGVTWDYLGLVSTSRAGFPSLSSLVNGRAIIACHTANAPSGDVNTKVFVDLAPGAGTWTARAPGNAGADITIWPSLVSTMDNRALVTSSVNATGGALYRNRSTDLTTATTWDGWTAIPLGSNANQSAVARSGNTLGIAYLTTDLGISYMQSNDNGVTWGAPTVIRPYNPADTTGTLRSIDMVFQSGQPRVIFGICKVSTAGFFPQLPSFMYSWSPAINGGTPVLIDSSRGLIGAGEVDVFTSVARGVLGASTDGSILYAAWCRARLGNMSSTGVHFFDVWFAYSVNGGATWNEKTRLTNISGPLKDNRWVSISPTNDGGGSSYKAYIVFQQDSIAGSYVNANPLSTNYMMFTRVTINPTGIKQIGSEIPNQFSLNQNYPNPFNPSTVIKFQVASLSSVKIAVFDLLGKEVATLVNEQLKPGTYEVDWDGSNFASGLYYYKLVAGNYTETKKMVLIK